MSNESALPPPTYLSEEVDTAWFTFNSIFTLFIASGTCDFEMGLCGYGHDPNADFQWTNNTGSTYSSNTGPAGDHSTGAGHVSIQMVLQYQKTQISDTTSLMTPF